MFIGSKREEYDRYGMDAFTNGHGGGGPGGMSEDDFFQEFFGGGAGFGSSFGRGHGPGGGRSASRRTPDAQATLNVTLKAVYLGKTEKMSIKRSIVCQQCKGSGAKASAKSHKCAKCNGHGSVESLRPIGNGLAIPVSTKCPICAGRGQIIKEKDKCKKCKGERITPETKIVEVYIPAGSKNGEKIVKKGMADEEPGKETGDIVFTINISENSTFIRNGSSLRASINITLVEALCGFNRPVIQHLDERVLRVKVPPGKVIKPHEVLLLEGEGMPIKTGASAGGRGDLYLEVIIEFPKDNWFSDMTEMRRVADALAFPAPKPVFSARNDKDAPPIEHEAGYTILAAGSSFLGGDDEDWDDEEKEEEDGEEAGCSAQ